MNKLLRNLLVTLGALFIYRLGSFVTIPFVNSVLFSKDLIFGENSLFRILSLYSGANLDNANLFSLGLGPYISASLICQALFQQIPSFKQRLKDEGNSLLNKYVLYASFPIALNSARIFINNIVKAYRVSPTVLYPSTKIWLFYVMGMSALVAGTMFLTWLSDMITEHGIGSGSSLIISASIMSGIPKNLTSLFRNGDLGIYILTMILILPIMTWAEISLRRIPLEYPHNNKFAQIFKVGRSFLPLKINLAGVVPSLFANHIKEFTLVAFRWLVKRWNLSVNPLVINNIESFGEIFLVATIILMSYVYMDTQFRPDEIAERLQNRPIGIIPNVRPGTNTENYIRYVANRLTFIGGLYISGVSILPTKLYTALSFKTLPILISTGLLIVVSINLEIMAKISSQLVTERYKNNFLKG